MVHLFLLSNVYHSRFAELRFCLPLDFLRRKVWKVSGLLDFLNFFIWFINGWMGRSTNGFAKMMYCSHTWNNNV